MAESFLTTNIKHVTFDLGDPYLTVHFMICTLHLYARAERGLHARSVPLVIAPPQMVSSASAVQSRAQPLETREMSASTCLSVCLALICHQLCLSSTSASRLNHERRWLIPSTGGLGQQQPVPKELFVDGTIYMHHKMYLSSDSVSW